MSQQQADHEVLMAMQASGRSADEGSISLSLDAELLCGNATAGAELPGVEQHLRHVRRRVMAALARRLPATSVIPPTPATAAAGRAPISCHAVGATFFQAAQVGTGIVVLDLFGGIGVGLEMALRGGVRVERYHHVDLDPVARQIMQHRLRELQQQFPDQLSSRALQRVWALPQNVWEITWEELQRVGVGRGEQWLVVAGWPCQDLSRAGNMQGLVGERSRTFHALMSILEDMRALQPAQPPAYLLENVDFRHLESDYALVTRLLGDPCIVDAARFGSLAHRVRCYWSNLADAQSVQLLLEQVERPANLPGVSSIMEPGRACMPVLQPYGEGNPQYPCNQVGRPRQAWPTLMARPSSRAFLPGCNGAVRLIPAGSGHAATIGGSCWDEPSAVERERAMGFKDGATAAPGVSEQQRRMALGNAMDITTMSWLYAGLEQLALSASAPPVPHPPTLLPASGLASAIGGGLVLR